MTVNEYPETAKFLAWYRAEQAKGLQSIRFAVDTPEVFKGNTPEAIESFCAEVNRMIAAPTVPDEELL
jgi:hypothetical protein